MAVVLQWFLPANTDSRTDFSPADWKQYDVGNCMVNDVLRANHGQI